MESSGKGLVSNVMASSTTQAAASFIGSFCLVLLLIVPDSLILYGIVVGTAIIVLGTAARLKTMVPAMKWGLVGGALAFVPVILYAFTASILLGPP